MRLGELIGLRWQDIDLERGAVSVRQQINRLAGQGSVVRQPKGKRGRSIPIPQTTVDALRTPKRRQTEERLRSGATWQDRDLAFASTIGTPLAPSSVYRRFKPLLLELGRSSVMQPPRAYGGLGLL